MQLASIAPTAHRPVRASPVRTIVPVKSTRRHLVSHRTSRMATSAVSTSSVQAPGASTGVALKEDDFATDQRPIIVFDGVCGVCNASVNLVLDHDSTRLFRFAALQSPAGMRLLRRCNRAPDDISSVVLVLPNKHYTKSDAALKIASQLAMPYPLIAALATPVPRFIRDFGYDLLARNRYKVLGKRDKCRCSDDGFAERFITE